MKIERHTWTEIHKEYPGLFARFFPDEQFNPNDAPAMVYTGEDAEHGMIGFLAGYFHNLETLYIQRIALTEDLRGRQLVPVFFAEAMAYARQGGVKYLMGAVKNTNRRALIAALKVGFLVNGLRMDTQGRVFVEVIFELQ
jgi:predicted GNAT superfamily acetyltransferase